MRIKNTEKKFPSNYETALKFAKYWVESNKELSQAKGLVVMFYKSEFTGFAIPGSDIVGNPDLLKALADKLQSEMTPEKVLVSIHSGLFG